MKAFNTDALKAFIKKYVPGKGLVGLNLPDYLDEKARCGCGIDCCEGVIHLTDKTTGAHIVTYISNGDWVTETWAEYQSTGADVIPGCTALNVPADDATGICPDAAWTWLAALNAEGYKVNVGSTTGGVELNDGTDVGNVLTVTPGSGGISSLNPNSEYFVTLIPYSDAGDKTGCTEISFTTLDVPAAFVLTGPVDDDTGVAVDATLTWNASTRATSYKLSIGTSTGTYDYIDGLDIGNVTTIDLDDAAIIAEGGGPIVCGDEYFWKVTAVNCAGETDATAEFSFETTAVPTAFALTAPADDAIDIALDGTLTWEASPGADSFELSIGTATGTYNYISGYDVGNITTLNLDDPGILAEAGGAVANNTEYFWIVRAVNCAGGTDATAEFSFTTVA